ncbi:hypothetical protein ACWV95_34225 [Streptomyces albus]
MALTTAQPSRARQPPPMRRGGTSRIAGVYLLAWRQHSHSAWGPPNCRHRSTTSAAVPASQEQ